MTAKRKPRIVIAGLGNLLMGDDGIGIHAVRELQRNPPPGVEVADLGTAVLHALHYIEGADRVLAIDAVCGGQAPGTVYLLDEESVSKETTAPSLHSVGLIHAMRWMPREFTRPRVTVLGAEPAEVRYGTELSASLAAVLPAVVERARRIVQSWQQEGAQHA